MADAVSSRSRSVRAAMQSTAQNQTGAQNAASVSAERQMPERGRQDHAGQHMHIVKDGLLWDTGVREPELRRERELLLYHSDCAHTTHIMLRALTNCHAPVQECQSEKLE